MDIPSVGHATQILHAVYINICASKAVNCREMNDDVPPIVTTLSSRVPKDIEHSLMNRTIFTTAGAVASTTDNNCQPVSPTLPFLATASLSSLLLSAPPIASLEDLTNGEQNSDITSARGNVAATSATSTGRNGIRRSDFKGYFLSRAI